jgi:hypothetical protein
MIKRILRIVVASPSDVQNERETLPKVLSELNRGIAADRGIQLEMCRWETDAYPGFHPEGPQGLIDPTLRIEDCDVLIAIFWKRFGTPAKGARSGTEYEILTARAARQKHGRPQIMCYFNQKPYKPRSTAEATKWARVLEFQENFPKEGLWWGYRGTRQFEDLVRNHLTNLIRQMGDIPEKNAGVAHAPGNYVTKPFYHRAIWMTTDLEKLAEMEGFKRVAEIEEMGDCIFFSATKTFRKKRILFAFWCDPDDRPGHLSDFLRNQYEPIWLPVFKHNPEYWKYESRLAFVLTNGAARENEISRFLEPFTHTCIRLPFGIYVGPGLDLTDSEKYWTSTIYETMLILDGITNYSVMKESLLCALNWLRSELGRLYLEGNYFDDRQRRPLFPHAGPELLEALKRRRLA